jgi:dihydroxyacetone kinase phosphoprotein-dependent L subunit
MNSSLDKIIFTTENLGRWFGLLRHTYHQNLERLNKLDGEIGDGDHGFTMLRAFQAAAGALDDGMPDLGTGFEMVSTALAENAGGAVGPILAAFFGEGRLHFSGKNSATLEDTSRFFQDGLAAVQEIGGAQPGEKTLVDALAPAVTVFAAAGDQQPLEVVEEALQAAREGVEATKELVAARGRSRFTADRSLGHPDPGAVSITLMLQSLVDFLQGDSAPTQDSVEEGLLPPPGKFINHPDQIVPEDNLGLALAYPELVRLTDDGILVRSAEKAAGKTALVIGHGGGHTPSMGGLVGPGLLDADVYGPVFTCASGMRIARAIEHGERGGGTVLLVSNHSGDVLNARLAERIAREKGIKVESVLLGDDIATAPRERLEDRRGLGGLLFALKTGGAAAEQGASLSEVASVMRETNRRTASLAVAVRPPTHPATGEKMFELEPGQIEIGTGVHGEVGVYRGDHLFADEIISLLLERLLQDLSGFETNQLLVFLNGSGGTSLTELHILYQSVYRQLLEQGLDPAACVVDSLFTTGEMGGFSLSLCAVDSELMKLWQHPAAGPSFHWPRDLSGRR